MPESKYAGIKDASKQELIGIIEDNFSAPDPTLLSAALSVRLKEYGRAVYLRGLVEFTNYCKNDCFYCGIRSGNIHVNRYRLTKEQILACCGAGYSFGFRTFVLQGGDDPFYTNERMCEIVAAIRQSFPDSAITLSFGEKKRDVYQRLFDAGANRFLLRHETADNTHYSSLHPAEMSPVRRKECLYTLKSIGYQVGAGFMVGSPGQTAEHLAEDLCFLRDLQPHMVGIGPFIPHHQSKYKNHPHGSLQLTLTMLALTRLMLPQVLLPATTAVASIDNKAGRKNAFNAGANVIMPNLSPLDVRKDYNLYDGKLYTSGESAEMLDLVCQNIRREGFEPDFSRGDHRNFADAC